MARSILHFAPSINWSVAILQLAPLNILFLSSVFQIQIWPCHIWFWGSFSQGLQWWCPHEVLCNSCGQGVTTWSRINLSFLLTTFSTSVHFEMLIICSFQVCFHVIFNHPYSKSAPKHIVICKVAGFQLLLHLSLCQIHRHYSVSGIDVLLSRCLTSCNCFDDHAILPCYLHLN